MGGDSKRANGGGGSRTDDRGPGAGPRRALRGSAGDERLVAQGDQVLAAHGQGLEDVAPVGLVLLDQQMLRAGGDALLDDRLPVQRALADFGELDDIALPEVEERRGVACLQGVERLGRRDRKSTRLNSSHVAISYAVFCLKKKTNKTQQRIME